MLVVYVHIAVPAIWVLLLEKSSWLNADALVPLEAIFLSTLVMIGQNLQAALIANRRQTVAGWWASREPRCGGRAAGKCGH
jgi:hypothetical protein